MLIGTVIYVDAANFAISKSWGLAGGADGEAASSMTVNQGVTVGAGTTITALDDVVILAGQNPVTRQATEIDALSMGDSHFGGLAGDAVASSTLNLTSESTLGLTSGSVVLGGGDVVVGAHPGVNSTTQYASHGYDRNFRTTNVSAGTVTESAKATLDGSIAAGAFADLDVVIDSTGTQLTVNGQTTALATGNTGFVNQTIAPPANSLSDLFVPFQVAYNPQYLPSLAGFDEATAALLESSVSQTSIPALQLTGLSAQGGEVVVVADQLAGSGTLAASAPRITISNPSADYLLLNGVAIPGGQTAGKVTLKGATGGAPINPGLALQPSVGAAAVIVTQTYPTAVGTGTSSGPAIYVTGYLNNPSGDVTLSNTMGAVVELAPINAASVSIETPNSAFILDTPTSPFGVGGNSADAWANTRDPLDPQPGVSSTATPPVPALTGAFLPGQTTTGWDANLAATTVVDYVFNGTPSSLAYGARTLTSPQLGAEDFAEYSLYNDSGVKDSNPPNSNPNGTSWIFFGNAIPFYNTGFGSSSPIGGSSDTREDAGTASYLGSGSGYYTNGSSSYYQFAYNGTGADAGALPLVVPNLPLQVTQPDSAVQGQLSTGLTAAQVSITAALIDINAPLNVGVSRNVNVVLPANLGPSLAAYRAQWQLGTVSSPLWTIPESSLGVGVEGVTATYNAQTHEITLSSLATSSSNVSALLTGGIVSTVSTGKINVIGGPGITSVTNATGIPLVLSGIDSGATQVTGVVEINDTLRQVSTRYVYIPGDGLEVFTAPLNQAYASTPTSSGTDAVQTYQPLPGMQINQQQNTGLVRELNFTTPGGTNGNGCTNVDTGNVALREAPVGMWNFANVSGTESDFGEFHPVGSATLASNDTALTLTDGVTSTASAAWLTSSLNTTVGFEVVFTYTPSGSKAADGIAFAFQNEGPLALGGVGGLLGYVGITGDTAAYQMNIYNGHTIGTAFVTNNTSGTYSTTGNVNIASGDPINVKLVYNPLTQTLVETLTDSISGATYTTTHSGVNLAATLGESCFVGFTGGDGGATSIQTITNFQLKSDQTTPWSPATTTLTLNGFSNFTGVNTTLPSGGATATLTNGTSNIAAAVWKNTPLDLTNGFAIGFVYQASGNRAADGIACVFQTEGLNAVGEVGGGLGYVGITGNTAAYQMNLYNYFGVGTSFVTTNTSGTYSPTGGVNIASGDPIQVQLVYNPLQKVLVETLTDKNTNVVYTATHAGIDLAATLGATECYVGFTGGSGGDTAIQTISDLVIALPSSLVAPVNSLMAQAAVSVTLPEGSALAQFVTVDGSVSIVSVTNKFGNNGSGPPWGVGNGHTWTYLYPTYYQLFQSSALKADNPFTISFEAMQPGGLSVVSSSDLVIDGLIRMAGDVGLTSVGSISQTIRGSIAAQNVELIADSNLVLAGFEAANAVLTTPAPNSVTLSDGQNNSASAVWLNTSLDTTVGFTAKFTYQAAGDRAADGIALVFQNEGLSALGGLGGSLGYVGISGATAAYQMNLYSPHIVGTNFVTTNTSGTYQATGAVNIASGDRISVELVYDPVAQTLVETLTDTTTLATYTTTYTGINLEQVVGATCFLGFTGADGGATSIQTVSDFQLSTQVAASVGTAAAPLQVSLTAGATLDAFGPGGVYVSSATDLTVDAVAAIPLEISGFTAGSAEWALVNGDVGIVDFSSFVLQGDAELATVNGVVGNLTLTDGTGYSASAAWAPSAVATAGFEVNFLYQASGQAQADGIAVVFQNAGTAALGGDGGGLGYVGIPGQTVAYEMNLYSKWGVGTNFVTTNSSTQYNSTGAVNIASGNPISVQLLYDGITQTLTETLTETLSVGQVATYQKVYTNIRLPALLGPTATFGFTGGDGALTSVQQVSVLPSLPLFQQTIPQLIGNGLLAIPSTGVGNQISAAWHRTPVDISRDFSTSFVYEAKGTNPADGLALVFQNAGLDAVGDLATYGGSSLGYAGLGNNLNTAAYEINIYNYAAPHIVGSNVVVNGAYGSYNTTGEVDFASGHKISVTLDYNALAGELTESLIDLSTSATWQRVYPLNLATALDADTALIGFTASNGSAFAQQIVTEFRFAYDVESTADVVLTSTGGSIAMAGQGSLVRGANVTLVAANSVGTAAPVRVKLDGQTLDNGSVVGGVLSGTAGADFSALVPVGDLRLGAVVAGGTVSLTVPGGNLTDGLTADASSLNRVANPAHRQKLQQLLWQSATAPTQQTITAYEGLIDRDYLQYWSLVSNGSVVNGTFTLNTAALPQFQTQAALYYGVPTASDDQVQSWAALTYVDCVNAFASSLAMGPGWASLPQFAAYDPTWQFVAPPATVIALSQGSESVFGVVSAASLAALNSAAVSGGGPGVNLQAGQVELSVGGAIGLIQEPVVIPLSDISNQTLTDEQRSLLELASVAGALQMVGTSATGETITYAFAQPPAGVTPTGVQVAFSRPIFTKIAAGGTLSATADSVSLTQTVGSLTIDSVVATGAVRLESQGSLLSSSSSGTAVQSGALTLITGGALGGATTPLGVAATGVVKINASSDVTLAQTAGELQIGQIVSGGQVWLQAASSIVDGRSGERQSFTGFNTDGSGWNVTTSGAVDPLPATPTVAVANDVVTFTNPVNTLNSTPVANSALFWRTDAISLDADWTAGFVYQSSSSQGGLSLMLYNGSAAAADPSPAWTDWLDHTGVVLNLAGTTWSRLPLLGNQVGLVGPTALESATPGTIDLGSGHQIRVIVSYTALESTLAVQLTDLTTGAQFTLANPNENLLQALGTNSVRFGFEAYASGAATVVQTVSDFTVLDGAANIAAASLEVVAGGGQLGFSQGTGVGVTPAANSVTLTDGINSTASAVWLNTPLDTTVGFTAQFTYQASGDKAADGITFAFQNQGLTALGATGGSLGYVGITGATAAYQMNLYSPHTVGTTFVTTNTSGTYAATGNVNIASGDPIEVTLVYDPVAQTVVETLTDSSAQTTFSRTYTGVNLAQLLGNSCLIGFTGGDGGATSVQTVSNFSLVPTISTAAIGTPSRPLTLLIAEEVSMVGPGGISLLEMAGNLTIGVLAAASSSTIQVSAPLGSILGNAPSQAGVSTLGGVSTQSSAEAVGPHISAGTTLLSALIDVGSSSNAFETRVGQLSAVARLGDLFLSNRGALTIIPGMAGLGLFAGQTLDVNSSQALQVAADVWANEDLTLEVKDWGLGQQALMVAGVSEITSQTGVVSLRAPDAVSLLQGSVVSSSGTNPGPNVVVALTRTSSGGVNAVIQSAGLITADRVSFLGGSLGAKFDLMHSGFVGRTQSPVVSVTGTSGVDQLIVNHRNAQTADAFVITATGLENAAAKYNQTSIDSLLLLLGDLGDDVTIRDIRQLSQIEVRGYGGNDRFRVEFESGANNVVRLDGGPGNNSLVYDGAGMPMWAKLGVVQSLTEQVVHTNVQNLVPWRIAALNGNPYLSTVDVVPLLVGLTPTQRYVQRTYLQILQRVATTAELNQWTTYLDQAPTDLKRRTQLVDNLSATDAARTLLLQAWFISYAGRSATPAEITSWLATFRSVSNPLTVQQRFLNSPPVYNAMQTYVTTGTPDQRYISGLWRLLVDPGTPTSASTLDYWMKQQTQLGRAKMTANMLGHLSYVTNQSQAFTQLINQRNAQYDELLARGPALVTFTGSVLDLSTAKVISPFELWRWLLTNRVS